MFKKTMDYIKDFLDNTPDDINDLSCDETPDICATGEPGMKPEEIEEFKRKLRIEYEKALKAVK